MKSNTDPPESIFNGLVPKLIKRHQIRWRPAYWGGRCPA